MATIHELKIWPQYYEAVADGEKQFEVRRDDRGFSLGDVLVLKEWNPKTTDYTGRKVRVIVTYVLRDVSFGVAAGFVVMSIRRLKR